MLYLSVLLQARIGLKVGQSWAKHARFVKYFCSGELMKGKRIFLLYRDEMDSCFEDYCYCCCDDIVEIYNLDILTRRKTKLIILTRIFL